LPAAAQRNVNNVGVAGELILAVLAACGNRLSGRTADRNNHRNGGMAYRRGVKSVRKRGSAAALYVIAPAENVPQRRNIGGGMPVNVGSGRQRQMAAFAAACVA